VCRVLGICEVEHGSRSLVEEEDNNREESLEFLLCHPHLCRHRFPLL